MCVSSLAACVVPSQHEWRNVMLCSVEWVSGWVLVVSSVVLWRCLTVIVLQQQVGSFDHFDRLNRQITDLSVCLFVCLFVHHCLYHSLTHSLSVVNFTCLLAVYMPVCYSLSLSVSVCLSVCLPAILSLSVDLSCLLFNV